MKNDIQKLITQYWQETFGKKKFRPGKDTIPASGKFFDAREMVAITEAALDGWWTAGRFVEKFEKRFSRMLGLRYCITTTSGSSANLLAISALTSVHLGARRLKPGDEVITIAAGFPTTINPLILYGLVPVFVDIDPNTFNVDVAQLKRAISRKTKAIFLPHNIGNPFNVDVVRRIARIHGLWLMEDCCDALGSRYRGRQVGTFGDLATFSFYAGHHMTMGEGGAVVTANPRLAAIVRSFRDWGREYWFNTGEDKKRDTGLGSKKLGKLPPDYDSKFIFSEIGFNLKITDMQAALGLAQLDKLKGFTKTRKENYRFFVSLFAQYKPWVQFQKAEAYADPSWFGFLITVNPDAPFTRREFIDYLHAHKIITRMLLGGNLTKQPYFRNYKVKHRISGSLTHTDFALEHSFWIGLYQAIDAPRRTYVARVVRDYLEQFTRGSI